MRPTNNCHMLQFPTVTNALLPAIARYGIEYIASLHNAFSAGFRDQANMHSTPHFDASLS